MKWGHCPVLVIGHGLRMAGGADLVPALLDLGVPILTSWQAIDLVDNFHPNYYGRPGLYGQRAANKILRSADHIVSIGCRLPIWMVGFEGFPWEARLQVCDVEAAEITKHPRAEAIPMDAAKFARELLEGGPVNCEPWRDQCDLWRASWPWVESPTHDNTPEWVNSYRVIEELQGRLRPDEVIVTDMGTALIGAHQVLKLRPPQRLLTSGGLGEMGCALPAAIGASFARGKGEVLCLHCDGGLMMNLQELATIAHHALPIKILVFDNEGYTMIKRTQRVMGLKRSGVSPDSGLGIPVFRRIAQSFGIRAGDAWTWEEVMKGLDQLFAVKEPAMLVFHMDPEQALLPKLDPVMVDGKPTSPDFADLSPRIG